MSEPHREEPSNWKTTAGTIVKKFLSIVPSLHFLTDRCRAGLRVIAEPKCQGHGVPYQKNSNNWSMRYVVGVASLGKVWCSFFFLSVLRPFSKMGNSRLHSTPTPCFGFYGSMVCSSMWSMRIYRDLVKFSAHLHRHTLGRLRSFFC